MSGIGTLAPGGLAIQQLIDLKKRGLISLELLIDNMLNGGT